MTKLLGLVCLVALTIGDGTHAASTAAVGRASAVDASRAAEALVREGRYADAVRIWDARLRAMAADDPTRADLENSRELYAAIADVPPQRATLQGEPSLRLTRNPLGTWSCAVASGAYSGDWIFDTGANLSTVVESEARAMGLELRETRAYVGGSTGARNAMRVAIARDLQLGPAHLTNVVFLVLSDEALYIGPLKYQIRGILGMPVLAAMQAFSVSADGLLTIGKAGAPGAANLSWDGWAAIARVRHGGRPLRMLLDSGANVSSFSALARRAFTAAELAAANAKEEHTGGAGGIVTRTTESLPRVRLAIGEHVVTLRDIGIASELSDAESSSRRDGTIGMDTLRAGFAIDFRTMRLTLAGDVGDEASGPR